MMDLIQQKKTTKSHVHSLECSSPRWFKIRKHLNLVSWPIIFWCRVLVRTTRTLNIWTLLFFCPQPFQLTQLATLSTLMWSKYIIQHRGTFLLKALWYAHECLGVHLRFTLYSSDTPNCLNAQYFQVCNGEFIANYKIPLKMWKDD